MPPIALPAQALHGRGDLGPADRIGCEEDPVLTAGLPIVLVQPDHQLHILGHGVGPEPAHLHHRRSPEQPESTRDDEQRVEVAPASPAGEEAAGVLQDLEPLDPVLRHLQARHPSLDHDGAVDRPDRATDRHDPFVLQEQSRGPQDCLCVQDGIGVHRRDQGEAGVVEGRVERVRPPASLLLDHYQIGVPQ